jgi:hypothetical protein
MNGWSPAVTWIAVDDALRAGSDTDRKRDGRGLRKPRPKVLLAP